MPSTVARRSALALGTVSAAGLVLGRGRAAERPVLKIGVLTDLKVCTAKRLVMAQ